MSERVLSPFDIKLEGIGHILRDRRLDVPPYQRHYSWDEEEVSEFWWDLRSAFDSVEPDYFLGTVVLTRARQSLRGTIIDGQQRLTTTALLFVALRNEYSRRGELERARAIERDYLTAVDLRTGVPATRLQLNPEDQPLFQELLSPEGEAISASNSSSKLHTALRFFEERIADETKNAGLHWAETLYQWSEFLENQARVISVSVADEADAFLIFETLNARGAPLTIADLLKNYIFGLSGPELPIAQAAWVSALRALETTAEEEVFTTYVRHLWASRNGATRERELYARLKASITSRPAALKFCSQLREGAPLYAALLNADQAYWASRPELVPSAESLLRLGLEQNRPLLLAAMRSFSDKELGSLIAALIGWSIRGLVVGGIGGGTTERAYAEAAVAVSESRAKDTRGVFEFLSTVVPTDEAFSQSFASRRITRTKVAKYLLIALDRFERGVEMPAIVSDATQSQFKLRSVLPRGAQAGQWQGFPEEEAAQWALRLGNLYLTDGEKPIGFHAEAVPTKAVWGPRLVKERQEEFAAVAAKIWPRIP